MFHNLLFLATGHVPPAVRCFNQRRPIASGTGTCLLMFTWLTLQTSFFFKTFALKLKPQAYAHGVSNFLFKKQIKLDRTWKNERKSGSSCFRLS